ncbi:MAG TPA: SRPBCC family protein [Nocardioidaceae bacterium]|nr:SRPBCC family protein [Nocardioidaceae bacterium]
MIELRDTVVIDASPDAVWEWLQHLPDQYPSWHPDHLSARWVRGAGLTPGAELEVRETLHGKPHRLRLRVTQVAPGRRLRYRVLPGLGGELAVDPAAGGSAFTAVIRLGVGSPMLGPLVDRAIRLTLGSRLATIERHQAEEGANLKSLLEQSPSA